MSRRLRSRNSSEDRADGHPNARDITLTEDVTLHLGATSTKVEVSASVVQLEAHTSQAATTIDQTTYASLPIALNGAARSPTIVADLMPGVADSPGVSGSAGPTGQAFSETINGGQEFGSQVLYDGAVLAQTNVAADYRVQPVPVEALQEFNLVQNSFSAEYTRTPGGILSFNTRSGTNQFHGELFEFSRMTRWTHAGSSHRLDPLFIRMNSVSMWADRFTFHMSITAEIRPSFLVTTADSAWQKERRPH